jgi:hypothetical protein
VGYASIGDRDVGEIEMLGSWRGQRGNRLLVSIWRIASLCLLWCLWKKLNARNFEDCETSSIDLKLVI